MRFIQTFIPARKTPATWQLFALRLAGCIEDAVSDRRPRQKGGLEADGGWGRPSHSRLGMRPVPQRALL